MIWKPWGRSAVPSLYRGKLYPRHCFPVPGRVLRLLGTVCAFPGIVCIFAGIVCASFWDALRPSAPFSRLGDIPTPCARSPLLGALEPSGSICAQAVRDSAPVCPSGDHLHRGPRPSGDHLRLEPGHRPALHRAGALYALRGLLRTGAGGTPPGGGGGCPPLADTGPGEGGVLLVVEKIFF